MSAEYDWTRLATEAAVSLISAATGLAVGVWRWGRNSAIHEQAVKDDYDNKIKLLRTDLEVRQDMLVDQFKESFIGLRRQIDDDRLRTEQEFVRKDDFKDFREEYRDDMRELKTRIAEITRAK